jgi:hypothetical protein
MITRTARLARWQIWLLGVSGLLLWLSGCLWLWLHYYGQVPGDFGPQTHPLEPWLLRLHGLMMIPALLGTGGLFVAHIPKGWKYRFQRVPGSLLAALLLVLTFTGYMLYYASGDGLRSSVSLLHWITGLSLPAFALWHYAGRKKLLPKDGPVN